jgi:hypothetical protein
MNKSVDEQSLDKAKEEFWQEILASDVLAQLVMDTVSAQPDSGEVTRENLPDIAGEVVLSGESHETRSLRIKMSRSDSAMGGVIGFSFATFAQVDVMMITGDTENERTVLVAEDGSFGLMASDALWRLDCLREEKAQAVLHFFEAWKKLVGVIQEVGAHYDRFHGFTTEEYNHSVEA